MTGQVYIGFPGRIVVVGFGSVARGVLPLLLRHIGTRADRITVIAADGSGREVAAQYGVRFIVEPLLRENMRRVLDALMGRGDFLLNLSVDVASVSLIRYCWERGAMYLDTCIEPWAGGYTDSSLPPARRTNYALREEALALRSPDTAQAPTALVTHGANPGLVSHLLKAALLDVARETGVEAGAPSSRAGWAALAQALGVRTIHIAERDTQVAAEPRRVGEFLNTWSVDGFAGEACQPAELGWGTHERNFPRDGKYFDFGCGSAIYLGQPGGATRVRTWTPQARQFHGFLVTHSESVSIADFYTVREHGQVMYRPTVHYAYHPCDAAVLSLHEFAGRNWQMQEHRRVLVDEITTGVDELGVLVAGHRGNACWYGSRLSVEEARRLAPHNNATTLQVAAAALAGMVWVLENPTRGLVEPDELDFRRVLALCQPYLGTVGATYTDWTPLTDRERLFAEDIDKSDPWQFKNVRVS